MGAFTGCTSEGAVVEGCSAIRFHQIELRYDLLIDIRAIGIRVQGVVHQELAMAGNACIRLRPGLFCQLLKAPRNEDLDH